MQAFKLKGEIDESGRLILPELVDLMPGKVEVIILSAAEPDITKNRLLELASQPLENSPETSSFESFMDWFTGGLSPVPPEFDADEAKWQYLKEKHNL